MCSTPKLLQKTEQNKDDVGLCFYTWVNFRAEENALLLCEM